MILYKYLPVERLEVLKTFLLRFSQPSALNDPYECLPSFEEIDPEKYVERVVERNKSRILKDAKNPAGVIRRQRAMKKASRDLIKEYRNRPSCLTDRYSERWKHHMNREIGILSLSKRSDSIVMWAHYASNHQGFAIGFESEHPFFKRQPDDNQDIGILQEVEYSPDRIEIRVADTNDEPSIFLRKNLDWSYEQEVRLIRRLEKATKILGEQDPKVHLFNIPKDSIHSVIVGMNSTEEFQSSVCHLIRQDDALRHVRHLKAVIDRKSFKLNTVEIRN